jgi:GAF domain-containing protein
MDRTSAFAWIRQLLAAPVFAGEERTRVARLLHTVLLTFLAGAELITIVALALYATSADPELIFTLLSGLGMTFIIVVLLVVTRSGRLRTASFVVLGLSWLVITAWICTVSGISSDSSAIMYVLVTVLAGLLLGGRGAIYFTLASSVAVLGAYAMEVAGLLVVEEQPISLADPLFVILPLAMTGMLLRYAVRSMTQALERARQNERAQVEANRELEALRATLEQRVADRTHDLERRSAQLQAAAELSRAATSILDIDQLLWQLVDLTWRQFELYHVSLFLLDGTGEWAEYRAGAGKGGRELADEGFRLKVGGASMVGWCTANAQARVAQDVADASGADTVRVDHELVPGTRSEAALPLIARGQVIGALSVQSDHSGVFDPDTVSALQTIADQVAIAVDNARLFAGTQEALETMRRAYGEATERAWGRMLDTGADWGYTFAHQAVAPVERTWQPEMLQAVRSGQTVFGGPSDPQPQEGEGKKGSSSAGSTVAIPLKVREHVVGVLGFAKDAGESWSATESALLERLVQQMGLALESAQFFQETQRRAAREQTIRRVTERMRGAVNVESILQNTVTELAKAMGAPRAYVRLGTEEELRTTYHTDLPSVSGMAGKGGAGDD